MRSLARDRRRAPGQAQSKARASEPGCRQSPLQAAQHQGDRRKRSRGTSPGPIKGAHPAPAEQA